MCVTNNTSASLHTQWIFSKIIHFFLYSLKNSSSSITLALDFNNHCFVINNFLLDAFPLCIDQMNKVLFNLMLFCPNVVLEHHCTRLHEGLARLQTSWTPSHSIIASPESVTWNWVVVVWYFHSSLFGIWRIRVILVMEPKAREDVKIYQPSLESIVCPTQFFCWTNKLACLTPPHYLCMCLSQVRSL